MKTKKIPLVIYTVIVAGLTILGTRLYDSVSDTTDPAIANGVSLEIGNFCTLSALFNQSWFVRG